MRRVVSAGAVALLGLGLLSGCGRDPQLGTGIDFQVGSALHALPEVDRAGTRVVVGDLGTLRSNAASEADKTPEDWRAPLDDAGVTALLPVNLEASRLATGAVRRDLGFDARDVVSYASLETAPDRLTVLRLAQGTGPRRGLDATGPGEPGERSTGRGTAFPTVLGLGRRDGQVALGQSAEVLVDWADKGATMADDDAMSTLAGALDDHDVFAAELVQGQVRTAADGAVPSYSAVGVGQSLGDEEGEVTTWVAYATADPGRFASAVRRVWSRGRTREGQPLSDLATLDGVGTHGGAAVVRLTPKQPDTVVRLLQQGQTPFVGRG